MRTACFGLAARVVIRFPDLLLAPWFLDSAELKLYFWVRVASLAIPLALFGLSHSVTAKLEALSQTGNSLGFRAAAARVNLGYLMVCGSMALMILIGAPYSAALLGYSNAGFSDALIWVVLGQAAPILFGATGLLMHVENRGTINELLLGLTAALFVASIFALEAGTAVTVAQTLGVAQLTHSAICAILLTQSGVWPGLTALFQKEIKLL